MAKKKLILFFALIIILLLIFLPGFSKYQKLLLEQRKLEQRIVELEETNRRLEEEKHKLETDIEYVERRAREKLGIVKKDEILYKIIEEGGENEE
jgi:cell division protein FtsB/cell division protein DivIC